MPEPPAHWKNQYHISCFPLGRGPSRAPTELQNCLFLIIIFLLFRGNGKWLHLCQVPWRRRGCKAWVGAQGSALHHAVPRVEAGGTATKRHHCWFLSCTGGGVRHHRELRRVSCAQDCLGSPKPHQKAREEYIWWKCQNSLSHKRLWYLI